MADRVICMMLGSPLTEYSVHLFKQSIQSCTLPSARKPVYRALCIVSLKHSAEYSVWSIQSAYYHLWRSEIHISKYIGFVQHSVFQELQLNWGVLFFFFIFLLEYPIFRINLSFSKVNNQTLEGCFHLKSSKFKTSQSFQIIKQYS